MKYLIITSLTTTLLATSCESKAGTGALVGAGVGVGAGALIGHSAGGALIGGAVGAAGGALIGAALDASDRENLQQNSPQTLHRIDRGQQLTLNDIKNMSANGVSDNVIIGQIQATNSIFYLNSDQIIDLKNAGVSQRVIDYMVQTGNH
jgi:outer membrane lipoprotein SlyB